MGNAQTVKRAVNGTVPVVLRTVQLSIKNIRKSIDKIYFLINIFNGNDVFQVLLLNKTAYLANDVYDFLS